MKTLWNHYSYAIILIILSCVTALLLSIRFDALHQNQYVTVTVSKGDTIWKIADDYADHKSLSKIEFVDWVQTHNEIQGDQIFPGEKIIIPVSSKSLPSMANEFASAAGK